MGVRNWCRPNPIPIPSPGTAFLKLSRHPMEVDNAVCKPLNLKQAVVLSGSVKKSNLFEVLVDRGQRNI